MTEREPISCNATEGELFRLLIETVKDHAIFVTDPEGRVRSWNPGAERLLGYSASEIIGQSAALFSTPESNHEQVAQREMDTAAETGRGEDERWQVRKDGSRFWSGGTITPLWDEGHRLRGFARIMRDRTAQKHSDDALKDALASADRAEQDRREVESRFTSLVKHVKDHSIFTLDLDGGITSWNEAAERTLGYSESEILGQPFSIIFTLEDIRDGVPQREIHIAGETGQADDVRWHLRKGGERFWADGIVTPLLDASGRHTGYSKVMRDMTGQKRMEDELLRAHEAVETQVRERTAELRTANDDLRAASIAHTVQEGLLAKSEGQFRELTAHLHQSLWMFDALEARVLYVSPGYEKIWGARVKAFSTTLAPSWRAFTLWIRR